MFFLAVPKLVGIHLQRVHAVQSIKWYYAYAKYYDNRSTHAGFYTAPNGVGIIWLDDVHCTKKTNGIDMCRHTEWGIHDCSHGEDVGVRCLGGYDIFQGNKINIYKIKNKT